MSLTFISKYLFLGLLCLITYQAHTQLATKKIDSTDLKRQRLGETNLKTELKSELKPIGREPSQLENLIIEKKIVAFSITTNNGAYPINANESDEMGTALDYKTEIFDESNRIRGGMFWVPADGIYHFNIMIEFEYAPTDERMEFELILCSQPETVLEKTTYKFNATGIRSYHNMTLNTTRALKKKEILYVSFKPLSSNSNVEIQIKKSTFSGYKVSN